MTVVVDASAMVEAFVGALNGQTCLLMEEIEQNDVAAPHLIDSEVLHVLRKLEHRKVLSDDEADQVCELFTSLKITRYSAGGLLNRIWALRRNLTCYDATYVALAEVLDVPFLTTDARIARASGHGADVRVFEVAPDR
ncbi:type II toxin-antitoxin system VapC family toxin [Actinoallomurus sp. NPDC050550]|uniref:type II toxin-antitoxin system VapC family toxin n=1 Tax=Actinoallomurus sp. NPDC050550 TaxID=3154937 RepID=UPI0033D7B8B4